MPTTGAPIWVELFTPDTDTATRFYGELFGWTAKESGPEYGGYIVFERDGKRMAGAMQDDGSSGAPAAWTVYLRSDDAAASAEKIKAAGGQVYFDPMPVGEMGTMVFGAGPDGAAVGVWQPDQHQGIEGIGEDNSPTWFELHTRSYPEAVAFYASAFDWDVHTAADTPDFRYSTLGKDEAAEAGIMDATVMGGEGASYWTFYVQVPDTDATVAKATELGGSITMQPENTPYGRLAMIDDPAGITFSVMGPNTDA